MVRFSHRARVIDCYVIDGINGLEASTEPGAIHPSNLLQIRAHAFLRTSRQRQMATRGTPINPAMRTPQVRVQTVPIVL